MTLVLTNKTHVVTKVTTNEDMCYDILTNQVHIVFTKVLKNETHDVTKVLTNQPTVLKIVVTKINLAEVTNCNICCHFHQSRLAARNTAVLFRGGEAQGAY